MSQRCYDIRLLLVKWCQILSQFVPVKKIGGRTILIGDATKRPKAERKIPLVKSLKSDSQDNNKKEFFMGHFFALVGVLAGISGNIQCVPIFISIQEGYYLLEQWQNLESLSHIERIVSDAIIATLQFGKSYLVWIVIFCREHCFVFLMTMT